MTVVTGTKGRADDFQGVYECGEAISTGDWVALAEGAETIESLTAYAQTDTSENPAVFDIVADWMAIKITVPANAVLIKTAKLGFSASSGTLSFTVRIRSTLTGSDLWSQADTCVNTTVTKTYSPNLTVTPGGTYWLIATATSKTSNNGMRGDRTTGAPAHEQQKSAVGSSGWSIDNQYPGGSGGETYHLYHEVFFSETPLVAKKIYKTSAEQSNQRLNVIGQALETKTAGQRCKIATHRIVSGLSSLTVDADYYLTNTRGTISATAGTIPKWIGRAKSATELDKTAGLDSPNIQVFTGANASVTVPVNGKERIIVFARGTNTNSNSGFNSTAVNLKQDGVTKDTSQIQSYNNGSVTYAYPLTLFYTEVPTAGNKVLTVENFDSGYVITVLKVGPTPR